MYISISYRPPIHQCVILKVTTEWEKQVPLVVTIICGFRFCSSSINTMIEMAWGRKKLSRIPLPIGFFSILIGRLSIFRYTHFDVFDIRVRYIVFRHKLTLKVCFRFNSVSILLKNLKYLEYLHPHN